jgi:hypothetical protein
MKKIGVLIYTHNRVDDAKINIEIIRNVWQKSSYFKNIKIVHSFNGQKEWYSKKYLEDDLVISKNTWHFQGASDLIDAGINKFEKNIDYVIVLASDTWLINPPYVENLLEKMEKSELYLATCAWGLVGRNNPKDVGIATDFFIIDIKWAKKHRMFPINYGQFHRKYKDLFLYQNCGNVMLEKLALSHFVEAVGREQKFDGSARKRAFEKILIMEEREPVHSKIRKDGTWIRKMYWPKMGLLTHHEPALKKKILKEKNIKDGLNIKRLLSSSNLDYFNDGVKKSRYSSN